MKTTLEIPDTIFRRAKAAAAHDGISFREFVTHAMREKLTPALAHPSALTGWRKVFGAAKKHASELRRIDRLIEAEFERIEAEDTR